MTASPLDALRGLVGEQFQELVGAVVSGEIPITTAVVNQLIAQKLATANGPITSATVEPRPADAFTIHLRAKGPMPPLKVDVTIDRQPHLPADPILDLRWTLRGMGALAMFAGPVISYFKKLPAGITLDGDRIRVDVHALLRSQGYGDLVPLLTGVRLLTGEQRFLLQFELRR